MLTERRIKAGSTHDEISESANAMMRLLLEVMTFVSVADQSGTPPWPGLEEHDHPIWHTAMNSGAAFVISDNTTDYPPLVAAPHPTYAHTCQRHVYEAVEYLTPIEFIEGELDIAITTVLLAAPPQTGIRRSKRICR